LDGLSIYPAAFRTCGYHPIGDGARALENSKHRNQPSHEIPHRIKHARTALSNA
jgi:hypothetical protein